MTRLGQLTVGSLMQRLMGGHDGRRTGNGAEGTRGLESLTERLSRHKVTRLALSFLDANAGLHLKDLLIDETSDDRRIVVDGHTVWNFGSDSFLGLDRHPRVHEAIRSCCPNGDRTAAPRGPSAARSSPTRRSGNLPPGSAWPTPSSFPA